MTKLSQILILAVIIMLTTGCEALLNYAHRAGATDQIYGELAKEIKDNKTNNARLVFFSNIKHGGVEFLDKAQRPRFAVNRIIYTIYGGTFTYIDVPEGDVEIRYSIYTKRVMIFLRKRWVGKRVENINVEKGKVYYIELAYHDEKINLIDQQYALSEYSGHPLYHAEHSSKPITQKEIDYWDN